MRSSYEGHRNAEPHVTCASGETAIERNSGILIVFLLSSMIPIRFGLSHSHRGYAYAGLMCTDYRFVQRVFRIIITSLPLNYRNLLNAVCTRLHVDLIIYPFDTYLAVGT